MVFPEFGLTATAESTREGLYPFAEIIPDVAEDPYAEPINPCAAPEEFADRPILLRMSCAARDNSLLVLVNTIDWVPCSDISNSNSNSSSSRSEDCPADGHFQYNTDVLFDENGVLVAKYHKSHEWPGFIKAYDQAPEPTTVTYSSSFGVQFGLFICFDIVFPDPAVVLVDISVRHFLYAVKQGQLGESTIIPHWSATHNATLLSANYGSGSADWKPPSDCSGIIVNGTTLDAKKVPLAVSTGAPAAAFEGENILIAAVPV